MFYYFVLFFFGWFSFASKGPVDVYLWKGENSLKGQIIVIPQYLIIASYARAIPSALFQKVDNFLIPPFLDGRECSANRDLYFSRKVKGVLPPSASLQTVEAFHVLRDPTFTQKLMYKLLNFKGIGIKGGPITYYLVTDSSNEKFILTETIAYEPNFYRYNSEPAKRAAHILSRFTGRDQEIKRVLLTFELTEEHNEKCGWGWPKGKEPKKVKPEEEIKIVKKRTIKFLEKHNSLYTFENIQSQTNQIELGVNKKSLAFLILNSSPLRIKNISLAK